MTEERLASAQRSYDRHPNDHNARKLEHAKHDYYLTKVGIQSLVDQGRQDYADRFAKKRERLIQESRFLKERNNNGKWSNIPLKEMDPGALTMALLEAADDPSIDWGTSSPRDFSRAINAATFWHRDQTRANRAGFSRTPYIEHPLRNALRAYRWGCTSGEVLTSIVLHDTIEDCADKINGEKMDDPHMARKEATHKLNDMFGENTTHIVTQVSNPIPDSPMTKAEKRIAYCQHLKETLHEPSVYVVKLADYLDNAGGLHHNYIQGQEGMVISMHTKYSMALPIFKDYYEKVKDEIPMGSNFKIRKALAQVEFNLTRLGERLREDGHIN